MTTQMLSFAGLSLIMVVLVALLLVQRRQLEKLRDQLSQQRQVQPAAAAFDQSLEQAEKQVKPESGSTEIRRVSAFQPDLTERYRCIGAMARQGLDAGQISAILQISESEARQVIRLAGVRGHQAKN